MTVPILSSTIITNKLKSMPLLELYAAFQVQYLLAMQICQHYGNPRPKITLTGKKITLPKMKAKNTRTGTVRGITGNRNLPV
jgi:hypothetical protein